MLFPIIVVVVFVVVVIVIHQVAKWHIDSKQPWFVLARTNGNVSATLCMPRLCPPSLPSALLWLAGSLHTELNLPKYQEHVEHLARAKRASTGLGPAATRTNKIIKLK